MNSKDAVRSVLANLKGDDIALFTTGYISRHAFTIDDRKTNFYMIGSMGLVSSVGLGMALNTTKKVFIFDGDGSAFMDMGAMAMIAGSEARNLVHLVLDNGTYESTGAQPTLSASVDLSEIARVAGYKTVFRLEGLDKLDSSVGKIRSAAGPVFVLLKLCASENLNGSGRVSIAPDKLASRIRKAKDSAI